MAKKRQRTNPFYVLLVLAGVAFALTASAYGVMTVKELHAAQAPLGSPPTAAPSHTAFIELMDRHGTRMMLVELLVLGATTFAAIGTDRWWSK